MRVTAAAAAGQCLSTVNTQQQSAVPLSVYSPTHQPVMTREKSRCLHFTCSGVRQRQPQKRTKGRVMKPNCATRERHYNYSLMKEHLKTTTSNCFVLWPHLICNPNEIV